MSVKITERKDEIFGNLITMSNDEIELTATLDFGPRIIHFSLAGRENMFCQDKEKKPILDAPIPKQGTLNIHKVYGGHRIWVGPEVDYITYYPDDFPVKKTIDENAGDAAGCVLSLSAPVEKCTGISKNIDIFMPNSGYEVTIFHALFNENLWDIKACPWAVTMMKKGGKLVIPQASSKTGYLPNRIIAVWPYADLSDKHVYWGREFITVSHDDTIKDSYKFGINNEDGWAAYFNCGQVFIKKFDFDKKTKTVYPDFGVNYETYFNSDVLEMETVGKIKTIKSYKLTMYTEKWRIYDAPDVVSNDEDEIKRVISPLLD